MLHSLPGRTDMYEEKNCDHVLFFEYCETIDWRLVFADCVQLESYWCRPKPGVQIPPNSGVLFGGLFDNNQPNPFTGRPDCPGHYQPYRLSLETTVCLSNDYQLDFRFSKKFGGFFSCQTPETSRQCPNGYNQHRATTLDGCDVYYCVRPEAFKELILPTIKRPPFRSPDVMLSNATEHMIYAYIDEQIWLKIPMIDVVLNKTGQSTLTDETTESNGNVTEILEKYMREQSKNIVAFMERVCR